MLKSLDELRKSDGNIRIIDKAAERDLYSHDIGDLPPVLTKTMFRTQPDLVVQPRSIEEIQRVVAFANEQKVAIVPRGAASWGFGGVVPTRGGIVIDLSPFRRILALDKAGKTVTVEAGARWSDIDVIARKAGLCLMTYPSSKFSTVGGWISTGGYGINSFRYGHLSKQIVSMTVVTGTGEARRLSPSDPDFACFISTEGEFGIVAEATLRLRDVPEGSYPRLLYFRSEDDAFDFIGRLARDAAGTGLHPNVIRFLDENHLADINRLARAEMFSRRAAVLVECGSAEDDRRFSDYLARGDGAQEGPAHVATYLWNERLFGMKTKRLGPSILASEVIIPLRSAAAFVRKAKRIGSHFGVEVCIDSYVTDEHKALVMATFLCDSRSKKYYIKMPLVAMLTKAAVMLGAEPYGLGLWNAPFVRNLYSGARLRELKARKARLDPNGVLNPGKFFGVGARGLAGIIFHPSVFGPSMRLMVLMAPPIGKAATFLMGKEGKIDSLDFELSMHACAKCGNCVAVCPAYLVTQNEAVTAKGKIALAKKLLAGHTVTREEAVNAFMCMRCRACEEICQTNLELMNLWDALEKKLEAQFGWPETQIAEYLRKVDASDEYWEMVEQSS
ncbi:MAG: FAD-binding protein [Dehalococcoidia bacterium]|nr:FAD-binding protein [Dehalococcoidia bacterium]